ncbi:WD40/YVTN/BNR-like repeat-containing protein [Brachybacterium phenoliresistens]|uniref:WD40/YVTN/BNR-like repeat-containing protein n=1 Tax=Brachybacterium phenoliresistens TaxID=396014 RepID=UPI0004AC9BB7|nr:sialidase family protein [Brachybacterium phenoliresistens]
MHRSLPSAPKRSASILAASALLPLCLAGLPAAADAPGARPAGTTPVTTAGLTSPLRPGPRDPAPSRPAVAGYTWGNVQIEGGGFVPGIIYNPTEDGLVYARTDIGGAYRLDREADRWVPLLDHVGWDDWNRNGVLSLATDPVRTERVYAAVGMYTNEWDPDHGAILRSEDHGETWQATELPFKVGGNMPGRGIGERLQIDPMDPDTLYFGAEGGNGLWRSTDAGVTWAEVESFPNAGDFVPVPGSEWSYETQNVGVLWTAFDTRGAVAGEGSRTIFTAVADTEDILYRSDDGGETWAPVPGAPTGFLPHKGVIDEASGSLYLTTSNTAGPYDGSDGEVWRYSIDDGTWSDITPPQRPVGGDFGFSGLSVDASDPDTLMVTTQIQWWPDILIFRSTDRGETWTPIWDYTTGQDGESVLERRYTQDISRAPWLTFGAQPSEPVAGAEPSPKLGWMAESFEINPHDPDEAMYGTGATIYRTENLTAWDEEGGTVRISAQAQGIEETAIQDLVAPEGEVDVLSAMLDLGGFVHEDVDTVPGMITDPYMGGSTSVDAAGAAPEVLVRAGTDGSGVHRVAVSRDAGGSWAAGSPVEGAQGPGLVAVTADGGRIVWSVPGIGVQVSTDGGATWTASAGISGAARVEADRVDPQRVYAWSEGTFLTSHDGGASFAASAGAGAGDAPGASAALPVRGEVRFGAVPGAEGEVWLAGGAEGEPYGLFRSRDGGDTWSALPGFDAADAVGFGKAAPGASTPAVYVSGERDGVRGIFRSIDGGAGWTRINDDQHQWGRTGFAITGDPDVFGRVYIATNGRGIVMGDIDVAGKADGRPGRGRG